MVNRSPIMAMSTLRISRMSVATTTTVTMQVLSMRISTIVPRTLTRISGRAYPVLHAPARFRDLGKSMQSQPLLKNNSRTISCRHCADMALVLPKWAKEEDMAQKTGEFHLKRIGNINGRKLFDCALDKSNIYNAIDNASKDHAHDPQVI